MSSISNFCNLAIRKSKCFDPLRRRWRRSLPIRHHRTVGVLSMTLAANIDANLDKLETLASNYAQHQLAPYISAIYITNSGTPSLSMTDTQSMNDQTAINLIQGRLSDNQGTSGNTTLKANLAHSRPSSDTLIAAPALSTSMADLVPTLWSSVGRPANNDLSIALNRHSNGCWSSRFNRYRSKDHSHS